MHAWHFDPRILTAAFAAFLLTLFLALVPSLPEIELGSSSGSTAAPSVTAPAAPAGTTTGEPRWVTSPLTPPAPW